MENNIFALPGTHPDDDEFICPCCLAEGVIADAFEAAGCTPSVAADLAETATAALYSADLL